MTKLLVSVRDAGEARRALAGGADLIDVKEPLRGALGAADVDVWRDVRAAVAGRRPFSVALGELGDDGVFARAAQVRPGEFAKIGLAGCADLSGWRRRWQRALDCLPRETQRVAVAYADYSVARAPAPRTVLQSGAALDCAALLVDTFDKSHGGLLSCLPLAELEDLAQRCRRRRMLLALAGALDAASLARVLAVAPDVVAVRGAACRGGRQGRISQALVKRLSRVIAVTCAESSFSP